MDNKNPSISVFESDLVASKENSFPLSHENFMLAFGLRDFFSSFKNDERYVKWVARSYHVASDGQVTNSWFPVHKCTDSDY